MPQVITEFEFSLPCGVAGEDGRWHRDGVMRRPTAADEILPRRDPRVVENPDYLIVVQLARVVVRLGILESVTPQLIESLYVSDLRYLEDLYHRINRSGPSGEP